MRVRDGVRAVGATTALLVVGLSCTDSAGIDLIEVNAPGGVVGLTFLDNNGNGEIDGSTRRSPASGSCSPRRGAATRADGARRTRPGFFRMEDIPVGSYRLSLDPRQRRRLPPRVGRRHAARRAPGSSPRPRSACPSRC